MDGFQFADVVFIRYDIFCKHVFDLLTLQLF